MRKWGPRAVPRRRQPYGATLAAAARPRDLDSVSGVLFIDRHGECDLPMRRQPKHRVRLSALFNVQGRAMSSIESIAKSISAEERARPICAPDERMRPRCAHAPALRACGCRDPPIFCSVRPLRRVPAERCVWFCSTSAVGSMEPGEKRVVSYLRGDGHASHCDSVSAGCLLQRQHRSARPTNERLQIMPRVSAGVSEKSYAGRLQQ
jgi:hypothetical protein